jgi:hypothetical protein
MNRLAIECEPEYHCDDDEHAARDKRCRPKAIEELPKDQPAA